MSSSHETLSHSHPETHPSVERMTARSLMLRIATPEKILAPIVSTDSSRPIPEVNFTESLWILKNASSLASNQLQIIGGGRRQGENGAYEPIPSAVCREAEEEAHVFGLLPNRIEQLCAWRHSFDYSSSRESGKDGGSSFETRRVTNEEAICVTEVPFFVTPQSYALTDNIAAVVGLPPFHLSLLFDRNQISVPGFDTPLLLCDSLSTDEALRSRQNVETDGQEDIIKSLILRSSLRYELLVRALVVDRLFTSVPFSPEVFTRWNRLVFSSVYPDASEADEHLSLIDTFASSVPSDRLTSVLSDVWSLLQALEQDLPEDIEVFPDLSGDASFLSAFSDGHRDAASVPDPRRTRFVSLLRRALYSIAFERNIPFVEHSGPQKPFLFVQNLLRMDTVTSSELTLLERHCAPLHTLYVTLCDTFGVDILASDPWYQSLQKAFRLHVQGLMHGTPEASQISAKLRERFCAAFGIADDQLTEAISSALSFCSYLDPFLSRSVSQGGEHELSFLPIYSAYRLDSILAHFCGVATDADSPFSHETQWLAARTILLAIQDPLLRLLVEQNTRTDGADPFSDVFDSFVFSHSAPMQIHSTEEWISCTMSPIAVSLSVDCLDGQHFSLSHSPELFTSLRVKHPHSLRRKLIERGSVDGETIFDYYGRLIVIDTDRFWTWFHSTYLDIPETEKPSITGQWSRQVGLSIMNRYMDSFVASGLPYQRFNGRCSGIFDGTLGAEELHREGSHASDIRWSWVKFVHQTADFSHHPVSEELQIMPFADVKKKKADDAHYAVRRLLCPHKEGYYPLTYCLFFLNSDYPTLIRDRFSGMPT